MPASIQAKGKRRLKENGQETNDSKVANRSLDWEILSREAIGSSNLFGAEEDSRWTTNWSPAYVIGGGGAKEEPWRESEHSPLRFDWPPPSQVVAVATATVKYTKVLTCTAGELKYLSARFCRPLLLEEVANTISSHSRPTLLQLKCRYTYASSANDGKNCSCRGPALPPHTLSLPALFLSQRDSNKIYCNIDNEYIYNIYIGKLSRKKNLFFCTDYFYPKMRPFFFCFPYQSYLSLIFLSFDFCLFFFFCCWWDWKKKQQFKKWKIRIISKDEDYQDKEKNKE